MISQRTACQGRLKSINNAIKALMVAWKSAFYRISDIKYYFPGLIDHELNDMDDVVIRSEISI